MTKCILVICLLVAGALAAVPRKTAINPNLNWRVIGGQEAKDGAHPHQISLRNSGYHSCGGSIISDQWIITAAHCVAGSRPSDLAVVAGSNKLSEGGDEYEVEEVHYHEDYDSWKIANDVAMVKTAVKITFNDKVRPIVVETEDVGGDVPCTVSGWGSQQLGGSLPDNLQEIDLKTTTVEYCQKSHTVLPVFDTQICTLTQSGEGTCHGDSGSPLIRSSNGILKQIGIVSWGEPCARGYPDVFSRVSSFVPWFSKTCDNCISQ